MIATTKAVLVIVSASFLVPAIVAEIGGGTPTFTQTALTFSGLAALWLATQVVKTRDGLAALRAEVHEQGGQLARVEVHFQRTAAQVMENANAISRIQDSTAMAAAAQAVVAAADVAQQKLLATAELAAAAALTLQQQKAGKGKG